MTDKMTVFSVGNGDSILLEVGDLRVLTDINYRAGSDDPKETSMLEFAKDIRKACPDSVLNIFVLTHPDKDHLLGFENLFHTGNPANWDSEDGTADILLVEEIWCSTYAVNEAYATDASELLLKEIRRRNGLTGDARNTSGNRLRIIDEGTGPLNPSAGVTALPLAPNASEAAIEVDEENPSSCNGSSLVIQWSITVNFKISKVLLGGDATAAVWERLHAEKEDVDLEWHVLVTPHHCSRYTLGDKDENDKFIWSSDALAALGHRLGKGVIISSSKELLDNDDDPPNWDARKQYEQNMLPGTAGKFLCTGGVEKVDCQHVVIEFTSSGVRIPAAAVVAGLAPASARATGGGSYG